MLKDLTVIGFLNNIYLLIYQIPIKNLIKKNQLMIPFLHRDGIGEEPLQNGRFINLVMMTIKFQEIAEDILEESYL